MSDSEVNQQAKGINLLNTKLWFTADQFNSKGVFIYTL